MNGHPPAPLATSVLPSKKQTFFRVAGTSAFDCFYLGLDPEAEIAYGPAPTDGDAELARISRAVTEHRRVAVAREAGISPQHLDMILRGKAHPGADTLGRLTRAIASLALADDTEDREVKALIERVAEMGIRACAVLTGIDTGHLSRVVGGQCKPTKVMLVKLRKCVAG